MNTSFLTETNARSIINGSLRHGFHICGGRPKKSDIGVISTQIYNNLGGHLYQLRSQEFLAKMDEKVKTDWEAQTLEKDNKIKKLEESNRYLVEKLKSLGQL